MFSTIFTAQKVIDGSVRGPQKKGGGGENSPISPPLDPRLNYNCYLMYNGNGSIKEKNIYLAVFDLVNQVVVK